MVEFIGFRWSEDDRRLPAWDVPDFSPIWTGPPITLFARGRLRTFANDVGRLAVVGHCLATDQQVSQALASGDLVTMAHLSGAYAFVFANERSGVALAVDAAGQFSVYFGRQTGRVIFGSHAGLVAKFLGAKVDSVALAADVLSLPGTRTAFLGVQRVDSGTALEVDKKGSRSVQLAQLSSDSRATIDTQAKRLQSSLLEAIDARVGSTSLMSSDFSGGLDSTSLAFLAVARVGRLATLTFHTDEAPVPDDADRARQYAGLRPAFEHLWVEGTAQHLPYQKLTAAADLPDWAPLTMAPLRLRLQVAAAGGSVLHLVGEGGDIVLSSPHTYLADLARRGELGRLWRHCRAWARLRGRSPIELFRRALLLASTSQRATLHALARSLVASTDRSSNSWEDLALTRWSSPSCDFLSRSARTALAEYVVVVADRADAEGRSWGDDMTLDQLRSMAGTLQAVRSAAKDIDISVHAPFLDTAVVEACLSVPAHRRYDPKTPKPLLRKALWGLVPSEVLNRRTKGDYTRMAYLGARRAAPRLRALLDSPASADYGVIDPVAVRRALESGLQGNVAPWGELNKIFALELWLRAQDSRDADV